MEFKPTVFFNRVLCIFAFFGGLDFFAGCLIFFGYVFYIFWFFFCGDVCEVCYYIL